MTSLRFSHILLILALCTWILAFIINLFFPAFLYSLSMAAALFFHSTTAVTFLLNLIPLTENNTLAMLCFLLAMACSFVAGAVYGMEHEAERYASINGGHWKEEEEEEEEDGNGGKNDRDLEKGVWEHPEHCEIHACLYFASRPFPYTPVDAYTDVPLALTSPADEHLQKGDAMTAEYYPSSAEVNDIVAQAQAQRNMLAHPQVDGRSTLELYLSERLPQLPTVSFATRKLSQEKERLDEMVKDQSRVRKERVKEGVASCL